MYQGFSDESFDSLIKKLNAYQLKLKELGYRNRLVNVYYDYDIDKHYAVIEYEGDKYV